MRGRSRCSLRSDNGWTGGQFSLFRAVFGSYLAAHFAALISWASELFSNRGMLPDAALSPLANLFPNVLRFFDPPWFATGLVALAAAASISFALGFRARVCAVLIWYVLACLLGRNPLISNPSLPFVGWILLATTALPPAPFGSWDARGRIDPSGGWRFPKAVFVVAWIVMALAYTYSGATKLVSPSWVDGTAMARVLDNPLARPGLLRLLLLALPPILLKIATWAVLGLELLFAPLALWRRARPWIWMAMVAVHVGLMTVVDFADLSLGMLMMHFFTLDPAWIPARKTARPEWVFYDGQCGLCHGAVRFALAEDVSGHAFRFAPLHGEMFQALVPRDVRLPDSLVVVTERGALLTKSSAVLHMLRKLGGLWRVIAVPSGLVPRAVRDAGYDAVAKVRHVLFAEPPAACPIVPPALRDRLGA